MSQWIPRSHREWSSEAVRPFRGPSDSRPYPGTSGTPAPTLEGIDPSVSQSSCIREDRVHHARPSVTQFQWRETLMLRFWTSLVLTFAAPLIYSASSYADSAVGPADEVIQWNKTLLTIVRTPGAQPATLHPTRSFAIMHAAIYDAVNTIDRTHKPYLVQLTGVSGHASLDAAAAAAAHEVLVKLYPKFQA